MIPATAAATGMSTDDRWSLRSDGRRAADPGRAPRDAPHASVPAAVAVFVGVALFLGCAGALPTTADRVARPSSTRAVRVESADTLWSIARANPQTGLSTAQTVSVIVRLNGGSVCADLHPGDSLSVPSGEVADAAVASR